MNIGIIKKSHHVAKKPLLIYRMKENKNHTNAITRLETNTKKLSRNGEGNSIYCSL